MPSSNRLVDLTVRDFAAAPRVRRRCARRRLCGRTGRRAGCVARRDGRSPDRRPPGTPSTTRRCGAGAGQAERLRGPTAGPGRCRHRGVRERDGVLSAPKATERRCASRRAAIQEALRHAADIPLADCRGLCPGAQPRRAGRASTATRTRPRTPRSPRSWRTPACSGASRNVRINLAADQGRGVLRATEQRLAGRADKRAEAALKARAGGKLKRNSPPSPSCSSRSDPDPSRSAGLLAPPSLPLLGYLALTLVMTYPLVSRFASAIPGDSFDGWQNYWNLWWVKTALIEKITSPWFTDLLYYPTGVSLLFPHPQPVQRRDVLCRSSSRSACCPRTTPPSCSASWSAGSARTCWPGTSSAPAAAAWSRFVAGAIFTFAPYHIAHCSATCS